MTEIDRRQLLTSLRVESDRRGWRDAGGNIRSIVDSLATRSRGGTLTVTDLRDSIAPAFLAINRVDLETVTNALWPRVSTAPPEVGDAIVPIDAIDSFKAAGSISPSLVEAFANPLALPERAVKAFIASIVGEPYVPKDWGGEGNDLYTPRVRYQAKTIGAAFLLKGSGTRSRLRVAGLGKNGDQIVRLGHSPAELLVVQHVGEIDEAVRVTLENAVVARRATNRHATGSIWDGTDTARLFVAFGFLDGQTGSVTSKGRRALARDQERLQT